jgi:hypothetical protein
VICGIADGYVICRASGGMLFVELAGAAGDLLCCNGRTNNMLEVGLD